MKILITGASGLIGTKLSKVLIDNGHSVNYLTTSISKIKSKPNFQGYFWNPLEGKIDENSLIGVEVIIHLAGATIAKRWTKTYKQEIIESRVLSAQLIFKTIKKYPNQVKQIISASGTGIYPNSYDKIYIEQSTEIDDCFLGNVVIKWEDCIEQFKSLNIKVAKIRTGIVFAKEGGALPEIIKPIRWGFGASMGSGKQIQSWIHIDDLINLYFFAIKHEFEGTWNAVAPEKISNGDLTKVIAKILEKPLIMPNVPKFFMNVILGEMCELLFTNKNISSQKAINAGFEFKFPTVQEALLDLLR